VVVMVTTTTELIDTGEKRDQRGRRIRSVEQRLEAVTAWRASGLTMAAFARRESIEYSTFAGWVLKVGRKGNPTGSGRLTPNAKQPDERRLACTPRPCRRMLRRDFQ